MKRVQLVETKIIERLAGQADEGLDDHFRDLCPHQCSFDFCLLEETSGQVHCRRLGWSRDLSTIFERAPALQTAGGFEFDHILALRQINGVDHGLRCR